MTTNYQPQFPGLQPPPNPGVPGKNAFGLLAAAVMLAGGVFVGVLIALNSTSHHVTGIQRDQAFLSVVHNQIFDLDNTSDRTLINEGHAVCNTLNEGGGLFEATAEIAAWTGIAPTDAGYFVGASIGAYCPRNAP